ncbi:MAG: SpoIIE family protein phosphatase [Chlorobi bacterium]|nr:SpoIIE family protein phosphatase [Chlorobiota bacterium]
MKKTTIFKQLILNVVIPSVLALIILAILNYLNTKRILNKSYDEKNIIISEQIRHILELQDVALKSIEDRLDNKMEKYSSALVNNYFKNTANIENTDLNKIRLELKMNPSSEDIYIINAEGTIVNTTFEKDKNINVFDFGEDYKAYILSTLNGNKFRAEKFTIEGSTKKIKKYTYIPTLDHKYVIELGVYSDKANTIMDKIKSTLNEISSEHANIISVDLFLSEENPFSLNTIPNLTEKQLLYLKKAFTEKKPQSYSENTEKGYFYNEYIYMEREGTNLYKSSVIRIITDKSDEREIYKIELYKFFILFGLTTLIVLLLTYKKTKVITDPIKKLVENVNKISEGRLQERAEVVGNNEITRLSQHFNYMLEQLEEYYNELEQKVKERTAEIQKQKEEIENQRNDLADKNQSLEIAYHEIEEQKKHITDSILYAKRIQNAILPPDEYIKKVIPQSFILYKPKDIVSGDFYWVKKIENKVIVAAVDCTGHGVPGAFMSIVGNNHLNYAVDVIRATKPADILDILNEGVTNALRQKSETTMVRDGMDIAICTFDFENYKIEYAGAYNPMYHIRNGELTKIVANKFSVGGFLDQKLNIFTNNELDIQKGDTIYIFSDGFADQFGGPNRKKFMYKPFRRLLLEIHEYPIEKQKEILEQKFYDWKGDGVQIDDILIIGIKIT